MSENVLDPRYWQQRLNEANEHEQLHHSVFLVGQERWQVIEAEHKKTIAMVVKDTDRILDVGCGYGRLLNMLPKHWRGGYAGIDISPDFIKIANRSYPSRYFRVADARNLSMFGSQEFDVAILISIKIMIIRNVGLEFWGEMEREIQRVAKKILPLEYGDLSEEQIQQLLADTSHHETT